ncbi:MAG TPA: ribonuclease D [Chitinophagales bacterium]|nr:ribonuclease D [Chitinophagales bacterium]
MQNEALNIQYITGAAGLQQCLQQLGSQKVIAFDLEFDKNNYTYGFNLCLIQIAAADTCYLIDPLVNLDLTPVFRLLEDPAILKVVHSPGEDLRLLHSLKCYPKNLFDTQVAIRLLNHEKISLADALENVLGIKADKKMQRSNWIKRPLTSEQLTYAANDVLHLIALQQALQQQALAAGVDAFMQEEFSFLETTIYEEGDKENFLKESEMASMSDYHQYVLNGLLKVRDGAARRLNKPPSWVIPNDTIRDVVYGKQHISSFLTWQGIHPGIKNHRFKAELQKTYSELTEAAKDLSKKSKSLFFTAEQRVERARMKEETEKVREAVFKPLQNELESRYGVHTGKFILGDGAVGRLIRKEMRLADIKENYRRRLIADTAAQVGVDITPYL